jgi:hypothetical protein
MAFADKFCLRIAFLSRNIIPQKTPHHQLTSMTHMHAKAQGSSKLHGPTNAHTRKLAGRLRKTVTQQHTAPHAVVQT